MTKSINFIELATLSPAERNRLLSRTEADLTRYESRVRAIIDAVIKDGDEALARFAREFDKAPVDAAASPPPGPISPLAERTLHARRAGGHGLCRGVDPPLP